MKALVYQDAHPIKRFAMAVAELPDPELRPTDILVEVKAIGINPGEAVFRATKSAEPGGRVLLGLEFSGIVKALGSSSAGFDIRDRVWCQPLCDFIDPRVREFLPPPESSTGVNPAR